MIVTSKINALDFKLEKEWKIYCKENGIVSPHVYKKHFLPWGDNGIVKVDKGFGILTEEEKFYYNRAKNFFKAERILPHVGWDEFVVWVQRQSGLQPGDFRPCDSKDGQCSNMCAKFGENCENKDWYYKNPKEEYDW